MGVALSPALSPALVYIEEFNHKMNNKPEITAILLEPCSSRAILSASSIKSIPKP